MTEESRALTAQAERPAPRSYLNVEEAIPILDTARFEQMQRIATVMAASSMIPDHLRGIVKDGKITEPYPPATIVSNCFMITEQSVRWNMSPFAVAQCTSFIYGRLMFEGKLVHAVLQQFLGAGLDFQWGRWDAKTERCIVGQEGEGDQLAVVVFLRGELGDRREVHGFVGGWKTTGNNSPWKAGAMKRQMRYRGSREWARAYEPGPMLGVVTDDEMDDLVDRRFSYSTTGGAPALIGGEGSGLAARLAAQPSQPNGFNAEGVAKETGGEPKPRGRPKKAATAPAADDTAKSDKAPDASTSAQETGDHDPDTGEIIDAQVEEIAKDEVSDGVAGPGEVYFMVSPGPDNEGRRRTFKDGKPFSTAKADNPEIFVYRDHSPAAEDDDFPGDKSRPTKTGNAPSAGAGRDSSASATDASTDSQAETSGPSDTDNQLDDGSTDDDAPYTEMAEKIGGAKDWLAIKQFRRSYAKTPSWGDEDFKAAVDKAAWQRFVVLKNADEEGTGIPSDVLLFSFWLRFAAKTVQQIETFDRAFRKSTYPSLSEGEQKLIDGIVAQRKEDLAA